MMDEQAPSYLTLSRLIAEVESGHYQYAIRFNPKLVGKIDPPVVARCAQYNHCSIPTANILVATAFGMHQLLGANLYAGIGYDKSIGEYLATLMIQERCFDTFVTKRGIKFTVDQLRYGAHRLTFIEGYNGKGDIKTTMDQMTRIKDTIYNLTSPAL